MSRLTPTVIGRHGLAVALVATLATPACHGHVQLRAPLKQAPVEIRLDAYEKLRPLGYRQTTTTTYRGFTKVSESTTLDFLQLSNGVRVYHTDDLLPLLEPGSGAYVAARDAESDATTASWLLWGGAVVGLAGTALFAFGPHDEPADDEFGGPSFSTTNYVGLGIATVGIGALVASIFVSKSAADERRSAFVSYDDGLRRHLGLCVRDGELDDCAPPNRPSRVPYYPTTDGGGFRPAADAPTAAALAR